MPIPAPLVDRLVLPLIGAPMFIASYPELVIAQCRAGVLVRAEKTARGWKGVYVALPDGQSAANAFGLEIDVQGRELSRTPLTPGGGQIRIMPPPRLAR